MTERLNEHHWAFTLLTLYSLVSLYLFLGYHDSTHRFMILSLYAGYYFSWSVLYHLINRNLTRLILLENLLITFLALVTLKVVFYPNL